MLFPDAYFRVVFRSDFVSIFRLVFSTPGLLAPQYALTVAASFADALNTFHKLEGLCSVRVRVSVLFRLFFVRYLNVRTLVTRAVACVVPYSGLGSGLFLFFLAASFVGLAHTICSLFDLLCVLSSLKQVLVVCFVFLFSLSVMQCDFRLFLFVFAFKRVVSSLPSSHVVAGTFERSSLSQEELAAQFHKQSGVLLSVLPSLARAVSALFLSLHQQSHLQSLAASPQLTATTPAAVSHSFAAATHFTALCGSSAGKLVP